MAFSVSLASASTQCLQVTFVESVERNGEATPALWYMKKRIQQGDRMPKPERWASPHVRCIKWILRSAMPLHHHKVTTACAEDKVVPSAVPNSVQVWVRARNQSFFCQHSRRFHTPRAGHILHVEAVQENGPAINEIATRNVLLTITQGIVDGYRHVPRERWAPRAGGTVSRCQS